MSEELRFPIGEFDRDIEITPELRKAFVETIELLPFKLKSAVEDLDSEQLQTSYRPDGWNVTQVVHHVADSHINAVCRFKLALTEDFPTIRPYYEDRWADLADSAQMPIVHSLNILSGLHFRWAKLVGSMTDEEFQRKLNHPESGEWRLDEFLSLYAWHSKHHTAHITALRKREGWFSENFKNSEG